MTMATIANWLLALFFLIPGIAAVLTGSWFGILAVFVGLLFLPPARRRAFSATSIKLTRGTRASLAIVGFIAFGYFVQLDIDAQEAAEATRQQKEEELAFYESREAILSEIDSSLDIGNHEGALAILTKYQRVNNEQLDQRRNRTDELVAAERNAHQTERLLAELESTPEGDWEGRAKTYLTLSELNPEVVEYSDQHKFYSAKVLLDKEKRDAQAAREDRLKAQFHFWDGSHIKLEKVIKRAMNDPDSYEHVETVYWDQGDHLVVKLTYRGRNGFGGLVLGYVKAKVDLDGNVLEVLEQE